jgi:large subunit ribosomal protein L24
MKIIQGDQVKVISGNERGKMGKVTKVIPRKKQIVVEGVNIHKKHTKSRGPNQPGGITEITLPIDISNVMLVCPKCKQPTRVKYSLSGSDKHRICGKCSEMIG